MSGVPIARGVVALALAAAVVPLGAAGPNEHWPQFRGSGSGVALDDPALPDTWSSTQNIAWKMTLATPAVAHGSVIVRTASKLYRIARTAAR